MPSPMRSNSPPGLTFQRSMAGRRPLTIREYESDYRQHASDLQLVDRIFNGGMDGNELRAALWPYVFGLVRERGRFVRKTSASSPPSTNGYYSPPHSPASSTHRAGARTTTTNGHTGVSSSTNGLHNEHHFSRRCPSEAVSQRDSGAARTSPSSSDGQYEYIEHKSNVKRWRELERLYATYENQWKSIMPDQELRFSVFRERKSLIERDVVRSDRAHSFYASDNCANLASLTTILMTYMMYDFDIGYLQGMSDLAAPILYVYKGDLVKSFWVFVEVMKLFRRNFEHSQKTIHFQLKCLYRLIKLTDPKLALYLRENDCSNCFFVFRCIVCQFKRELMKSGTGSSSSSGGGGSDSEQQSTRSSSNGRVDDDDDDDQHSDLTSSTDDDDDGRSSLGSGAGSGISVGSEHSYAKVLNLWDTIWSVQKRHELLAKSKCVHTFTIANPAGNKSAHKRHHHHHLHHHHSHHHSHANHHHHHHCNNHKHTHTHAHEHHRKSSPPMNISSTTQDEASRRPSNNNNNNSNDSKANQILNNHNNNSHHHHHELSKSYQNQVTPTSNINHLKHNHLKQQQDNREKLSTHDAPSNNNITGTTATTRLLNHRQLNGSGTANRDTHKSASSQNGYSTTTTGHSPRQQLLKRQSICSMCSTQTGSRGSCCSLLAEDPAKSKSQVPVKQEQIVYTKETFYSSFDPNQTDVPRFELTETEKFVLALCVSLIRRERNTILSRQMDASEIHQHFINPQLADNMDAFMAQAYEAYHYLNTDCDLQSLVKGANDLSGGGGLAASDLSPICGAITTTGKNMNGALLGADGTTHSDSADTTDTFDLLKDYLIISPTSYNIPMSPLNHLSTAVANSLSVSSSSAATNYDKQRGANLCHSCTSNSLHHNHQQSSLASGNFIKYRTPSYAGLTGSKCSGVSQKSWDHALNPEATFSMQ